MPVGCAQEALFLALLFNTLYQFHAHLIVPCNHSQECVLLGVLHPTGGCEHTSDLLRYFVRDCIRCALMMRARNKYAPKFHGTQETSLNGRCV